MTIDNDPRDIALDTLAAAKKAIDRLNTLEAELHTYNDGPGHPAHPTRLARKIGHARETIRWGLKFAEVNALIGISDRLETFAELFEVIDDPAAIPGVEGRPLAPEVLDQEHRLRVVSTPEEPA